MDKYIEDTLNYYDMYAEDYRKEWTDKFISEYDFDVPDIFLNYLEPGSYILDFGCGVGRDIKYFLDKGYKVKGIDGSKEMCKIATEVVDQDIECINFLDINYDNEFDGVFCCASLLHLNNDDLMMVLKKLYLSLKSNGILFVSFKYGENDRYKGIRYFNDMTEDKFLNICNKLDLFDVLKVWQNDVYDGHKGFILFILRKK